MTTRVRVWQVAVPAPLFGVFDYRPPAGWHESPPKPGVRVRVPFGRRQMTAVVVGGSAGSSVPGHSLKAVQAVLDSEPVMPAELLDLCRWVARYYHHPLGEVLATALPTRLRQGAASERGRPRAWRATADGRQVAPEKLSRAPKQAQVLASVCARDDGVSESSLKAEFDALRAPLKALQDKGLIEPAPPPAPDTSVAESGPELGEEQTHALNHLLAGLEAFQPTLLDGVTGSGKTEVYLRLIREVLSRGRQALVLVPEIGLTPQLVDRFRRRLPGRLAVMHSGLGDAERQQAWLAARDGDVDVLVGTRSAVFTPLARPGLIVVDEEHDPSLKQQDGLRYSARDVAVRRASTLRIPIVLGSATPALETLHNALTGRYDHLRLTRRAGGAQAPRLRVLDVRGRPMREGISGALLGHVSAHLEAGGQVLLFLNRRGYAPTLICHDCGWVAECRRCDARLTVHQRLGRLRCHHCGAERAADVVCPDCGSEALMALGQGTERIEGLVRERFPGVGVARIDRDTTARKGAFEALTASVNEGEARILIGTQMLAKGHHFPEITLVGVINADQGLFGVDFRAPERMAQLVTQVAGRAGRAERPGEVYIQTHHPEHPLLLRLIRDGYASFAEAALLEREQTGLPPFAYLALLRAESTHADRPMAFLAQAGAAAEAFNAPGVMLAGPVPAPMERRAGRVRAHLLLQALQRGDLHRLLGPWTRRLSALPAARQVRWSLDVDPQDLL